MRHFYLVLVCLYVTSNTRSSLALPKTQTLTRMTRRAELRSLESLARSIQQQAERALHFVQSLRQTEMDRHFVQTTGNQLCSGFACKTLFQMVDSLNRTTDNIELTVRKKLVLMVIVTDRDFSRLSDIVVGFL